MARIWSHCLKIEVNCTVLTPLKDLRKPELYFVSDSSFIFLKQVIRE